MNDKPENEKVQEYIGKWREHITKYYYNCTIKIFSELGKTYFSDERFRKNIDKYRVGLSEFMSKIIEFYVLKENSNL